MDGSGNVDFIEEDGIDYAAVTVQLAGGERVPFLFTIKELTAKGNLDGFGGDFLVPSYRGSSFLDPKVRRRTPLTTWPLGSGRILCDWKAYPAHHTLIAGSSEVHSVVAYGLC